MQKRRSTYTIGNLLSLLGFILLVSGALVIFVQANRPPSTGTVAQPISNNVADVEVVDIEDSRGVDATSQPTVQSFDAITDANLLIPAAGINATVIRVYLDGQSWDVSNLGMNIGHLQGTRWVTEGPGNIVLSGHVEMRDGRKGIFAEIGQLTQGDMIILQHEGTELRYSVSEIRNVDPTDLEPIFPTEDERLTLITCDDYDFFRDSYKERTIIVAERIS